MKAYVYLLIGLVLGALLGRAYWPVENAAAPSLLPSRATPSAVEPGPVSQIAPAPTSAPLASAASAMPSSTPPAVATATPIAAEPTPAATATPETPATTSATTPATATEAPPVDGAERVNISFTREFVSQLEKQGAALGKQVRLRKEKTGWRVVRVTAGSLFARTGLQRGDLITRESIESLRQKHPGEEQLPERVVKILDRVSSR